MSIFHHAGYYQVETDRACTYVRRSTYTCTSIDVRYLLYFCCSVADIRGGRDKDDNSSVRLDHLLTQRHTPHPHCSPSVGGNTFPQSMHLSHISYCTCTYTYSNSQSNIHHNRRTPYSDFGLRLGSPSPEYQS